MKRKLGITLLLVVIFITVAVVLVKVIYFPSLSYRYRMTVAVDVDGQVHSSSSVIEIRINYQPQILTTALYVPHTSGEAVFVDLGKGRNVIALLASGSRGENVNYTDYVVPDLFGVPFREWARLPRLNGAREVPASRMPTFVTFTDLTDPTTARVVAPEDFPKVFGADVSPPKVTIEMTRDRVTRGIERRMPMMISKLRERAKTMQVKKAGSPFRAELGYFWISG